MFGKVVLLKDDWPNGICITDVLAEPVNAARNVLKGSHHESLKLIWESIELGFNGWKEQHGQSPVKNPIDPSPKSHISFEDAPPYLCAGYGITCYADLFAKLIHEKFFAIEASPENLSIIYAVLTLEAAARGDADAAHKANVQLNKYNRIAEMTAVAGNYSAAAKYIDDLKMKLQPVEQARSKGGIETGKIRKGIATQNQEKILNAANRFINSGMDKRNLVSAIAEQIVLSKNTVRSHLKKAGILSPRKKVQ